MSAWPVQPLQMTAPQQNNIVSVQALLAAVLQQAGMTHAVREGRGTMARARSFANVTACRAVSNPAWCRIFREISCLFPLNIGTLSRCCVLGQDTLPSHASLDSGVNEYLVGQRWQCVRLVPSAEMAASAVCSKKGVEMVHE